jgi:hypothetical protein
MAAVTSLNHKPEHQPGGKVVGPINLLNRVAARPWVLSVSSFTLTALLLRWNDLIVIAEAAI